jgi:hypothetical protein
MHVDLPENVAATLTEVLGQVSVTNSKAAVDAIGVPDAAVPGVVGVIEPRRYTTSIYGDTVKEFFPNRQIGKDSDGKFYVVLAIKGTANVAAKNISISAEFTVL